MFRLPGATNGQRWGKNGPVARPGYLGRLWGPATVRRALTRCLGECVPFDEVMAELEQKVAEAERKHRAG